MAPVRGSNAKLMKMEFEVKCTRGGIVRGSRCGEPGEPDAGRDAAVFEPTEDDDEVYRTKLGVGLKHIQGADPAEVPGSVPAIARRPQARRRHLTAHPRGKRTCASTR